MKKKINVIIANPAGNITIFVLDKFKRAEYQDVATKLLAMKELKGEQLSFILKNADDCDGKMEMAGLEFCGNASRSFALITARRKGIQGIADILVDVSGSSEKLTVSVNTDTNYTKIKMPQPLSIQTLEDQPLEVLNGGQMVDLGGIVHIVLKDVEPTEETFNEIKTYINKTYNPPAMGVMFYDTKESKLVPVVYVKDINTTYFEGSCASGSTAVAVAFAQSEDDGTYSFTLPQPAGTICSTVEKENGKLKAVYIEGPVEIGDIQTVEVDLD